MKTHDVSNDPRDYIAEEVSLRMEDPGRLVEAWQALEADGALDVMGHDVAGALVGHPDDRAARAERLLTYIAGLVEARMTELVRAEANDWWRHRVRDGRGWTTRGDV